MRVCSEYLERGVDVEMSVFLFRLQCRNFFIFSTYIQPSGWIPNWPGDDWMYLK